MRRVTLNDPLGAFVMRAPAIRQLIVDRAPEAVVVRHAEHLAALAGEDDRVRPQRGRRVQVVARGVDQPERPAERPVGIQDEEAALARANVDVVLPIDRR